jgi:hypothetical protein
MPHFFASLDSERPIENVRTLEEIRALTLAPQKLNASLVAMFALLSLAIAAVGVFGVLGLSVGQRTKEFGIRSTLGADARELLRMVLGEGMKLQTALSWSGSERHSSSPGSSGVFSTESTPSIPRASCCSPWS